MGLGSALIKQTPREFPWASQVTLVVKNQLANAEGTGSIAGLGESPGEGNGNPLQYSCLGNPMGRKA